MIALKHIARRPTGRRAFSLMEMIAVVAIVGLLAGAAALRWGDGAIAAISGEGFVRSTALSLNLARRQAISEGIPAAVVLRREAGIVSSVDIVRAESSGDSVCEASLSVPRGLTVTSSIDRWEFDFTGGLTAPASGGAFTVTDGVSTWTLVVNGLTGTTQVTRTP